MTPDLKQLEALLAKATTVRSKQPRSFADVAEQQLGNAALNAALFNAAPALIAAARDAERLRETLKLIGAQVLNLPPAYAMTRRNMIITARAALTKEPNDEE